MSQKKDLIRQGLNKSGLFFEEVASVELGKPNRFVALKQEQAYAYKSSYTGQYISGSIDYLGYFYREESFSHGSTVFCIECKKVNVAKSWLFVPMQKDDFSTEVDEPGYIRKIEIDNSGKVVRRSGTRVYIFPEKYTIKSFEMRDSGNVYQGNDEKIFNACRQAIRATNGFYLDDAHVGLSVFDRPLNSITLRYVPMVLTNAEIFVASIDPEKIDMASGELNDKEGFNFDNNGWTYYVMNLSPEEMCSLSMESQNNERVSVEPNRIVVPIVNINHIDGFLKSYMEYVR